MLLIFSRPTRIPSFPHLHKNGSYFVKLYVLPNLYPNSTESSDTFKSDFQNIQSAPGHFDIDISYFGVFTVT